MTKLLRAGAELVPGEIDDPPQVSVSGVLFGETDDGRRLRATGGALGMVYGDPSALTRDDVENSINAMLGRASRWPRPPRLSWEQLHSVLDDEGIDADDEALIALPFEFEYSPELLAKLDR